MFYNLQEVSLIKSYFEENFFVVDGYARSLPFTALNPALSFPLIPFVFFKKTLTGLTLSQGSIST